MGVSIEVKRIPEIARLRKDLAEMYRKARKDNPKLALLLRDRIHAAEDEMKRKFETRYFSNWT